MGFGLVLRLTVKGEEFVRPKNREPDINGPTTVITALTAVFSDNTVATGNISSAVILIKYEHIFMFDFINHLYFNNNRPDRH